MSYDFLNLCLDDTNCSDVLLDAVENFGRAKAPAEINDAFLPARLTALTKPKGGVRDIATSTAFRRLVARPSHVSMRPSSRQLLRRSSMHCQPELGQIELARVSRLQ